MNKEQLLAKYDSILDTLDESSQEYAELSQKADLLSEEILTSKTKAKVDLEVAQDQILRSSLSSSFPDWDTWAHSLYPITKIAPSTWKITSLALDWDPSNPKEWTCCSTEEVLAKIQQLISYKIYDRERGIGDKEKDLLQAQPRVLPVQK